MHTYLHRYPSDLLSLDILLCTSALPLPADYLTAVAPISIQTYKKNRINRLDGLFAVNFTERHKFSVSKTVTFLLAFVDCIQYAIGAE